MLTRLFLLVMCGELWCYMHEASDGYFYYIIGGGVLMTIGDFIIMLRGK